MESVSNQLETIRLVTSQLRECLRHKDASKVSESKRHKLRVDLFHLQKIEFNFNNVGAKEWFVV